MQDPKLETIVYEMESGGRMIDNYNIDRAWEDYFRKLLKGEEDGKQEGQTQADIGSDPIVEEAIKYGRKMLEERIQKLVEKVWNEEKMPDTWSKAIICPIHKKDQELDVTRGSHINTPVQPGSGDGHSDAAINRAGLIFHRRHNSNNKFKEVTTPLVKASQKMGLEINQENTKYMEWTSAHTSPGKNHIRIQIDEERSLHFEEGGEGGRGRPRIKWKTQVLQDMEALKIGNWRETSRRGTQPKPQAFFRFIG
ncbi:hypothetical protein ILUMI_17185 [Ignelater luminosus]|uniref:Uncharacterized protein n=1 Tax=Ignelater luminosus TaxID=2038154 RepID=A0A8K0G861_IGNLU|nr:hypothetical protein ILUMI_17185 [Ignelater luminosus]